MQKKAEELLEQFAETTDQTPAPASFRSRLYTSMLREVGKTQGLRPVTETLNAGYAVCAWENLTRHLPGGEERNHCIVCHARVIAETFDSVAMPWSGCSYGKLHTR